MRALILSDLHIEHAPFVPPQTDYELVILAGDIHNGVRSLQWARTSFGNLPIIQVAGNHEYYDHEFHDARLGMREAAQQLGIHWLDDQSVTLGNIDFHGCTLWTDFRLLESGFAPPLGREQAMQANLPLMADFRAIRTSDEAGLRCLLPADTIALHERSIEFLRQALGSARSRLAPRVQVVVNHHLPSARSVSSAFADSVTNAAFASHLDALIAQADWWIHGHTHSSHDYRLERARVICNPRGYPRRRAPGTFENPAFRADLVVNLSGPHEDRVDPGTF